MAMAMARLGASHELWRWFVLQYFGVYYDDYMRSVEVHDECRWRRLFIYIRQVRLSQPKSRGSPRGASQCGPAEGGAADHARLALRSEHIHFSSFLLISLRLSGFVPALCSVRSFRSGDLWAAGLRLRIQSLQGKCQV